MHVSGPMRMRPSEGISEHDKKSYPTAQLSAHASMYRYVPVQRVPEPIRRVLRYDTVFLGVQCFFGCSYPPTDPPWLLTAAATYMDRPGWPPTPPPLQQQRQSTNKQKPPGTHARRSHLCGVVQLSSAQLSSVLFPWLSSATLLALARTPLGTAFAPPLRALLARLWRLLRGLEFLDQADHDEHLAPTKRKGQKKKKRGGGGKCKELLKVCPQQPTRAALIATTTSLHRTQKGRRPLAQSQRWHGRSFAHLTQPAQVVHHLPPTP